MHPPSLTEPNVLWLFMYPNSSLKKLTDLHIAAFWRRECFAEPWKSMPSHATRWSVPAIKLANGSVHWMCCSFQFPWVVCICLLFWQSSTQSFGAETMWHHFIMPRFWSIQRFGLQKAQRIQLDAFTYSSVASACAKSSLAAWGATLGLPESFGMVWPSLNVK